MTATKTDQLVADYLLRLETALRPLPTSRRDQLLSEIREHIHEGLAGAGGQSEASVRELLDRLGEPEDISAAALTDEPTKPQKRRLAMGAAVVVTAGITAALLWWAFSGHGSGSNHEHVPPPKTTTFVTVPNVLGQSATQAIAELQSVGLTFEIAKIHSSSIPPGDIISISPTAGSKVKVGSQVRVRQSVLLTPSVAPSNWSAEGARLIEGMKANHVHSPDGVFAYQSLPIDITRNGIYHLDFGPVSSSFNPKPRPLDPFALAFDFPSNRRFMIVPGGLPSSTVMINGKRYFPIEVTVSALIAPYPQFTCWIYP